MKLKYTTDCLKQILEISVILMFAFSTSSTTESGTKSETEMDGYVTIRNIGIKLCQLKCIEHGACLNFEYKIQTLTCRLSRDEWKRTEKEETYISHPRTHSDTKCTLSPSSSCLKFPTSSCTSKTCGLGLRCLETRSGKAVCVQDGKQNCPDTSPQHNTDSQESSNRHALHDACLEGDLDRVRCILSRNVVDVNSRDQEKGWTPLMVAAWKGNERIFDFLIRKGANTSLVDSANCNILHWACAGGHVHMVEHVLTQYSVYINSRTRSGKTPLMKAAYHGHIAVLDYLLSAGANVSLADDDGDNLLHFASMGGYANMVKHILSRDLVNINSKGKLGRTPLMRAAYYGNRKMFDLLVRKGSRIASVDDTGESILHLASMGGHLEMVKYILSHNMADINAKDNDGETAAMLAERFGHHAVYDFLQHVKL